MYENLGRIIDVEFLTDYNMSYVYTFSKSTKGDFNLQNT